MPLPRTRSLVLIAASLLAIAACKPAAKTDATAHATASANASAGAPGHAVATAESTTTAGGSASNIKEENDDYSFVYSWPAPAGGIADLQRWLEADRANAKAELVKGVKEARADAKANNYPFNAHYSSTEWQVVADLPGWLSLTAMQGTYSGGAHGMNWTEGLLWDKAANRKREVADLFTSPEALGKAIRGVYCDKLDTERSKRRELKVDRRSGDEFDACIDPLKQTLILGSSDKAHFDRIGIIAAPYEAGPYAEGQYDITVPVTAQVLALVKPEYKTAFALGK